MFSEDDWSRRKVLKTGGAFTAGSSTLAYLRAEQLKDQYDVHNYKGVPEDLIEDPEFYDYIRTEYPGSEIEMLDPEDENMILDYHVIGDVSSLEAIVNIVERDFEDIGMEVTSLVNENYETDWFMENYGTESRSILGGGDLIDATMGNRTTGFWDEQVDEIMKKAAVQVIYIQEPEDYPGDKQITHDIHPLAEIAYDLSGSSAPETSVGVSTGDRTAVFVDRKSEYRTNGSYLSAVVGVTKHEVGHSLGLSHKEDTLMAPILGMDREFDNQQIEEMLEPLS